MEVLDPLTTVPASAIIFDLDGVLANSIALVERSWRVWCAEHQLDAEKVLAVTHGRRKREIFTIVAPHLDADAQVARLIELEQAMLDLVEPIPGAADFVRSLPAGSWAIGTSGEREVAVPRLRRVDIPVPSVLIAAEDVEFGKPNPSVYLQAAAGIGADPARCVVFEDAPLGLQAASAAKMSPIALLTTYPRVALEPAIAWLHDFRGVVANTRGGVIESISFPNL